MNFVALPESNNQIIEVTNHTLVCVGKLAYESAGTAVQGCSAFGGRVDFANSLFYWVTGHVHDTYQVGNSEKKTDTSTNIQALCCSHVGLFWFVHFQKLKPIGRDRQSKSLTMPCAWRQRPTAILFRCSRLSCMMCIDLSLRCAYDLPPRYHCISMCCVSAAWASSTSVFMLCQTAALLTSSPDAELRFQGEGLHEKRHKFSHEKMPCFMS